MPPTTADQTCPDEIETETDAAAWFNTTEIADLTTHPAMRLRIDNALRDSTTPTSTTAISRSPRRRVGLDLNDLSVPAASSQDFAALIGHAWRIGHRRGARLRPGTGPARAGGARATIGSNPPSILASTLVMTRHVALLPPAWDTATCAVRAYCCSPHSLGDASGATDAGHHRDGSARSRHDRVGGRGARIAGNLVAVGRGSNGGDQRDHRGVVVVTRGRAGRGRRGGPAAAGPPAPDVAGRSGRGRGRGRVVRPLAGPGSAASGIAGSGAGGWAVGSSRVSALEDWLTALEATAADDAGRGRARTLRDAGRASRNRLGGLIAAGDADALLRDVDAVAAGLDTALASHA